VAKSIVNIITNEASKDLFRRFVRTYVRLDKAVEFGHQRWTHIDKVMLEDEGDEVKAWWIKLSRNQPYKSLLRRMIWEKFLLLLSAKVRQRTE
jgi:hypothetical protein